MSSRQDVTADLVAVCTAGRTAPVSLSGTKNHDAARRAVAQIRKSMQELAGSPTMGRSVDDMPAAFREWLIDFGDSGYVARYRLDAANITVLAIRHQKEAGF